MPTPKELLDFIDDNPGDFTAVLVFADWQDENGFPNSAKILRNGQGRYFGSGDGGGGGFGGGSFDGGFGGDGSDGSDGSFDGGGDGDGGGFGGGGFGGGDGDGGGFGGGDGSGGDGGGADADGGIYGGSIGGSSGSSSGSGNFIISRGFAMVEPGLHIICVPAGYYPYVRIGWCERRDDMLVIRNCRVIKKFGTLAELAAIAEEGPKVSTKLLTMAKYETTATGLIARCIPCNPKAWAKECPKPEVAAAATGGA